MNNVKNTTLFVFASFFCALFITPAQGTDGSGYDGVLLDTFCKKIPEDAAAFAARLQEALTTEPTQELSGIWRQIVGDYFDNSCVDFKAVLGIIPGELWLSTFTACLESPELESPEVETEHKIYAINCMTLFTPFYPTVVPRLFAYLQTVFNNPEATTDIQLAICQCLTTIASVSPELSPECWNNIKHYLTILSSTQPPHCFHEYMEHFSKTGTSGDIRTAREHLSLIEFLLTLNLKQPVIPPVSKEIQEGYTQLSGGDTTTYLEHSLILQTCMKITAAHTELIPEVESMITKFLTDPQISDMLRWYSASGLEQFVCQTMLYELKPDYHHTPVTLLSYRLLNILRATSAAVISTSIESTLTRYENEFRLEQL